MNADMAKYLRGKLRKMIKRHEKYMSNIDPNVMLDFYLKENGEPTDQKKLGKEYKLSMKIIISTIEIFRRVLSTRANDKEEDIVLLVERYRMVYRDYFRRDKRAGRVEE